MPICIIVGLVVFLLPYYDTLDTIESNETGNGQHGTARFATEKEKEEYYKFVKDSHETEPGFIIDRKDNGSFVDTSDTSTVLIAPPGGRKTTSVIEPCIEYNGRVNFNTNGKGASMIITSVKEDLYLNHAPVLQEYGYATPTLNFCNIEKSHFYNILNNINNAIDEYKTSEGISKIKAYARAEKYAKVLAESIVDNVDGVSKNDTGQYFTETSKGLVTGLSLLVSEYGEENERHIISVFKLIIELNGLAEGATESNQKSRLAELLEHIDNERIKNYVGPAMSADMRSAMNIFSSALGKLVAFIDMELEQLICRHSPELSDIDFINEPTAIFIICPDENTTRHFFASLFIRYLMNDLIGQSRETNGVLKRKVLCFWDEFGNMPPIKNVDVLITAARSRGIRFLIALQSISQLESKYNKKMSEIILDSLQCTMFTYVSPMAYQTAELFSKILGTRTVKTGSVTLASNKSVSYQMMSQPLLRPSDIIKMEATNFIILKGGQNPVKTKLPYWKEYYHIKESKIENRRKNDVAEVSCLTVNKILMLSTTPILQKSQFD